MPTFGDTDLRNRTAIVTGGTRGIGQAVALALARRGMRVLITGRDADKLAALRQQFAAEFPFETAVCDNAVPAQIEALFARARQLFPKLDLLVNNAAIGLYGPCDEVVVEEWDMVQDVNARGAFLCAQHAFRWMKAAGGGRIINIASVVGHRGYENQVSYAASKHAVLGFTKVMAREGQKFGIRVNAISPGGVATDLVKQARPDLDPASLIQPDDVARAVLFFVTEPASCCVDELQLRRADSTPFG